MATDVERPRLSWRLVARPTLVVTLLSALLAVMYLGYIMDPEDSLHDFPIAVVAQDDGDVLGGKQVNVGQQIADGIRAQVPADKIDLRMLEISAAERQLQTGKIYGAIIIPHDFSKRLGILGAAGVVPGDVERPVITVVTNPRTGTYATALFQRIANTALAQVQTTVGKQLLDQVGTALQPPPGGGAAPQLTGAARLQLAEPINVVVSEYRPLPTHTGQGLTAFFYTLMLLLAGFTGGMMINTMTDGALGYFPMEYGPWYLLRRLHPISRLGMLVFKWAITAVMAPVVSGLYLVIAALMHMPLDHPLGLWLYSTLAVFAIGVTALSVLAATGTAGLLINLILFVVLGLPSSSGTIPIEAVPRNIAWLATFEPMHQVYLAVRSILYFNASGEAGLTRGVWMTVLGLAIGLILGLAVTVYYDRKGWRRIYQPPGEHEAL
ncbi:YhgE/Pip domain-containing protein [Nocardia stercoris]|uniref:DUF3533 domain-containing protein n=1 Tax=Nocardia stercoris TaxID=2483361 RepID=A0A3M2L6L5_9NOCA|nr:DUF3533 domain-containing protein [Nocardia stercoris]RMI32173.1 DUF3533 domain-containing protein [Nocardia stercoris]